MDYKTELGTLCQEAPIYRSWSVDYVITGSPPFIGICMYKDIIFETKGSFKTKIEADNAVAEMILMIEYSSIIKN